MKSKLILNTYDGSLEKLNIKPKFIKTKATFNIKYYDKQDILTHIKLKFKNVITIDFSVNYFQNCIGSELAGFYEIFDMDKKLDIINKAFDNRFDGYMYHGDYDLGDEHDMLNNRLSPINFKDYSLFQLQTMGGIYYILAKSYKIIKK